MATRGYVVHRSCDVTDKFWYEADRGDGFPRLFATLEEAEAYIEPPKRPEWARQGPQRGSLYAMRAGVWQR